MNACRYRVAELHAEPCQRCTTSQRSRETPAHFRNPADVISEGFVQGVRLAKEELMSGAHTCYGGWAALEFHHRQDATQTLLK